MCTQEQTEYNTQNINGCIILNFSWINLFGIKQFTVYEKDIFFNLYNMLPIEKDTKYSKNHKVLNIIEWYFIIDIDAIDPCPRTEAVLYWKNI